MRHEDASGTGSFTVSQADAPSTLNANNDIDVILAGHYGPATGNAISGAGTISGSAGADLIAAGRASITAIEGAGGTDTSFSGGNLQVAGQYGVLTINAQGTYSYARNQGTPDGVSDVFSYTLSSRDGSSDIAQLTIDIGKTATIVQANAVQVIPGPDGVVTLPAGVELSDIHVVGSDLVVDLPDGTQMIIVDGAVFVPQIVLGTVEVPASNLAALLIDSEPTPAAGQPLSSGGNFAVPVAPLDPGAPLGDLIPPTELDYTPPEFEDVTNAIEDDEAVLITDLIPSVSGGDVTVDEDDLPAGSDTTKESLTVAGTFTLVAPDGVESLTVGSLNVIVAGVFQGGVLVTPLGNTLTVTGYDAASGVISYTYVLGAAETHPSGAGENSLFEDFLVTLTDEDGDVDTDTLSVNIVDDVPTANDDSAALIEGGPNFVTLDVDTNDVAGADGPGVRSFTTTTGTYGNLTLNPDGTQTYTLNAAGQLAIDALPPGATLTDSFPYTLTDGDGDSDPATLVVTLTGANDPPLIFNLTPRGDGGEAIVDEDDLSDGSSPNAAALTVLSSFNISAPDGIDDLTVGGIQVIINGVFQTGATGLSPLGNQVIFTGFNPATGEISVSYTLLDNETHASGLGDNNLLGQLFDDMTVTLTDVDGETATDTLSVKIIDDVPTANDDAFAILEGDADNAITFDVDLNDVPGADGTGSRSFTSLAGTYGNLVVNADGTETYTLNATGMLAINALADGATLNDNFSYTLTDNDGDSDPATLVITLTGADDPVLITDLTPSVSGGDTVVDEDDLPTGSDTSKESLTVSGDFTISTPDGLNDLSVGGHSVIVDGVFIGGTLNTPLGNSLTFTGYNTATGLVSYTYTLNGAETHPDGAGENDRFEDFAVILTDIDNDPDTDTLSVRIIDDVPIARADADSIVGGIGPATGNVITGVDLVGGDANSTDGSADVPGADGASITRVGSNNSGAFDAAPDDGGDFVVVGQFGILTINTNGDYSYLRSGIPGGANPEGVDVFTYTLTDGDDDQVTTTLTIAINNFAAADNVDVAAKGSYTCGDDTTWQVANASVFTEGRSAEGQRSISAANTNTALIAALAAAGVAAAAAAKDPAPAGDSDVAAVSAVVSAEQASVAGDDETSRSALTGDTRETTSGESSQVSSKAIFAGEQSNGGHSLAADNDAGPATQPVDLLEATNAPASLGATSIVAPMVSMPSAEALIAAKLEGGTTEGSPDSAIVGKVLIDALEGGEADASVDALLEALPAQGPGANAAVEALASQHNAAVSAWDLGHSGGLSVNASFTMEAMTLHHDAVQPVANG